MKPFSYPEPAAERSYDRDDPLAAPRVKARKHIHVPDQPFLRPHLMWAELEHFRKLADWDEVPFSLLLCTLRGPVPFEVARMSMRTCCSHFAKSVGPAGMLDRNRVGLIIREVHIDQLLEIIASVRQDLNEKFGDFTLLTYPFEVDGALQIPQLSSYREKLTCRSMQSLFCLPTPWGKRAFDIMTAVMGLILLFPILLMSSLLIVCFTDGPIFYKQRRTGLGGRPFDIYKFRTMVVDAEQQQSSLMHLNEQDGPAFKIACD